MSDYNFLMETRLSPPQFQVLNKLSRIAHEKEVNLYLVGGAVRDMTYGQATVRNLDFAVEGEIQKLFPPLHLDENGRPKPGKTAQGSEQSALEIQKSVFDKRLRSARLWFGNGVRAEVGQCRTETFTTPGRPVIAPCMVFDDLKRRDFALNAMAVSLHPNSRGLLLDPKNGVGDIERAELRVLHPRSFIEDPVRIYRLLRLALRLNFKPEEKTQRWLDNALEERAWTELTPEGQARELEAVLREENPDRVLKLWAERGILSGLDRNLGKIPYEQFRKVRAVASKIPNADPFLLNFHCLTSKLGSAQKKRLAEKIFPDTQSANLAINLQKEAKKAARLLGSAKFAQPSQAYKLLSTQPEPVLLFLLAYYPQAAIQTRIKNYLLKAPQVRARLPRQELLALGAKPGPKFDQILERIFFDQLDGKIKTHQQLEKELRSLAGIKEPPPPPPAPLAKPAKPVPAKRKGTEEKSPPEVISASKAQLLAAATHKRRPHPSSPKAPAPPLKRKKA